MMKTRHFTAPQVAAYVLNMYETTYHENAVLKINKVLLLTEISPPSWEVSLVISYVETQYTYYMTLVITEKRYEYGSKEHYLIPASYLKLDFTSEAKTIKDETEAALEEERALKRERAARYTPKKETSQ